MIAASLRLSASTRVVGLPTFEAVTPVLWPAV